MKEHEIGQPKAYAKSLKTRTVKWEDDLFWRNRIFEKFCVHTFCGYLNFTWRCFLWVSSNSRSNFIKIYSTSSEALIVYSYPFIVYNSKLFSILQS